MSAVRAIEMPVLPRTSNSPLRLRLCGISAVSATRCSRMDSQIASGLPCENSVVAYYPETVIERFKGQLHRIAGGLARVTLVDSQGGMFYSDCPSGRLTSIDLKEGDWFYCTLWKTSEGMRFSYEAIPRRPLSRERQIQIRNEVKNALRRQ